MGLRAVGPRRGAGPASLLFIKKLQPEGEVEFVISVKEFAPRNTVQMRFYAQADKEINQKT